MFLSIPSLTKFCLVFRSWMGHWIHHILSVSTEMIIWFSPQRGQLPVSLPTAEGVLRFVPSPLSPIRLEDQRSGLQNQPSSGSSFQEKRVSLLLFPLGSRLDLAFDLQGLYFLTSSCMLKIFSILFSSVAFFFTERVGPHPKSILEQKTEVT